VKGSGGVVGERREESHCDGLWMAVRYASLMHGDPRGGWNLPQGKFSRR
jgi:hypothetical protein